MNEFLDIAPEVRAAIAEKRAVVALESTIIAHGMPYPQNLAMARAVEGIVRAGGAVPATIAIIDGRLKVGLDAAELELLARVDNIAKASTRDIPYLAATRAHGATTVAATMRIAALAGIRVFATGGIGGVHRGDTGDISHDLVVLAQTPIAIVSAGAKAILDLPRTVETLETLGVLVIGFRTAEFPAFYTRSSGVALDHRVDSAAELAAIARARWDGLSAGGILVCNPIPDRAALDATSIDIAIATALAEATAAGITGKRLTPHLLARLAEVTGGASIRANRALVLNNAQVASELAVALAR